MRLRILFAMCLFCVAACNAQEQLSFSTEGEVKKPVALPHAVEKLVMQDRDVRDTMVGEGVPLTTIPKDWYGASEVHLSAEDKPAILVVGHSPMGGAHAAWFWICAERGGRWTLLLRATGDVLDVQETKAHGWNDVETSYYTASILYSWRYRVEGKWYKLLKESEKPLK